MYVCIQGQGGYREHTMEAMCLPHDETTMLAPHCTATYQ